MKILVNKKGEVLIKDDNTDSFELYTEDDVKFEDKFTYDKCKMMLGCAFTNIHINYKEE